MRVWGEVWRHWPWPAAWVSGGTVAGILLVLWVSSDRAAGGLIAALMNGVTLFFLVGGVFAALAAAGQGSHYAVRHPWLFALVPAGLALLILAALRLSALALHLAGPWSTVPDSLLDVSARAAVIELIIGIAAVRQRRKER